MADETITFEFIRKIQRDEQMVSKLTKLPDNFYENVATYLEQKRKMAEINHKVAIEVKNIERLIEDIFNRRERKILNQSLITVRTKIEPENLTDEEKEFFDQLVYLIKDRREKQLITKPKQTKHQKPKSENVEKYMKIKFKEDVPEFIGADMKNYGPFKKDEIMNIPEANAKLFVARGLAEPFE